MRDEQGTRQPVTIGSITVREAWRRLQAADEQPTPALVDVRETWEFTEGHALGAVNIPLSALRARHAEVPRERDVFFICHVGQRSFMAARFLAQLGVRSVYNVEGGTDEWEAAHLPMEHPVR